MERRRTRNVVGQQWESKSANKQKNWWNSNKKNNVTQTKWAIRRCFKRRPVFLHPSWQVQTNGQIRVTTVNQKLSVVVRTRWKIIKVGISCKTFGGRSVEVLIFVDSSPISLHLAWALSGLLCRVSSVDCTTPFAFALGFWLTLWWPVISTIVGFPSFCVCFNEFLRNSATRGLTMNSNSTNHVQWTTLNLWAHWVC